MQPNLTRLFALDGRRALVTGASSGLGRHFCSFMAARYSACGRAFAHVGSVSGDTALLQSAPCEGGSRGLVRVLPNLSGI